jgi:hypothetical protein
MQVITPPFFCLKKDNTSVEWKTKTALACFWWMELADLAGLMITWLKPSVHFPAAFTRLPSVPADWWSRCLNAGRDLISSPPGTEQDSARRWAGTCPGPGRRSRQATAAALTCVRRAWPRLGASAVRCRGSSGLLKGVASATEMARWRLIIKAYAVHGRWQHAGGRWLIISASDICYDLEDPLSPFLEIIENHKDLFAYILS